jgi:hypothetical protein
MYCPRADSSKSGKVKKLREVLEAFEPPPLPVSLVYPHAKLLSPRVRAFVDFAADRAAAATVRRVDTARSGFDAVRLVAAAIAARDAVVTGGPASPRRCCRTFTGARSRI